MKIIATLLVLLMVPLASDVYGCDEACLKAKAEAARNIKYPTYMSWKFCDDTRQDFMTTAMRSIQSYKEKHFDTRYKGGMRNIKNYIEQRKKWLVECDSYLYSTKKARVFEDNKTTWKIFHAIDSTTKELTALINGVTYSSASGADSNSVMIERFDELLTAVENHHTLMHLKGRYVYR